MAKITFTIEDQNNMIDVLMESDPPIPEDGVVGTPAQEAARALLIYLCSAVQPNEERQEEADQDSQS